MLQFHSRASFIAQYTQPIGNIAFSINGPIYLPEHQLEPDDNITYIPDIEIEFDIFLHNPYGPRSDYQVLNVGLPDDSLYEFPKLLLDTGFYGGEPGKWIFNFDNPKSFSNTRQTIYLEWNGPTILQTGQWTHLLQSKQIRTIF